MQQLNDLCGQTLAGRFDVTDKIGQGGMGAVYLAKQTALGRQVAIKVMLASTIGSDDRVERFLREASVCAQMHHSNTVRVFDFGREDDGTCWLAMEYLQGYSLRDVLQEEGSIGVARAIHIAEQIAYALQEAHEAGVIHRDIKPGNIMLVQQGDDVDHVKVVDFGLVKQVGEESISNDHAVLGSPQFMAPEQVKSEPIDARTDIYGLGMVLYHMLSGRVAFKGRGMAQLMYAHVNSDPIPFGELDDCQVVPGALERVVMRCLAKEPDDRFESAYELARTLHKMARRLGGTVALRSAQGSEVEDVVPSELELDPETAVVEAPAGLMQNQRVLYAVLVLAIVGWCVAMWLAFSG